MNERIYLYKTEPNGYFAHINGDDRYHRMMSFCNGPIDEYTWIRNSLNKRQNFFPNVYELIGTIYRHYPNAKFIQQFYDQSGR